MSTEKPTEADGAPKGPPAEFWGGVIDQTKREPQAGGEPARAQDGPEVEKGWRERTRSRPARIAAGAALLALATALAWVVVSVLVGGDSTTRPRPSAAPLPTKGRRAEKQGSGRTRWVREPGASPRRRRMHGPQAPQARRDAHPRPQPPRPAPPPPEAPSQPPASGPAPAEPPPAPEPSAPEPPPPDEPKEKPGIRDGATESNEFGL